MPRWVILIRCRGGEWQLGPTGLTLQEAQRKLKTMAGVFEVIPCRLLYTIQEPADAL